MEPRAPSFFNTLVQDNLTARYVQNMNAIGFPVSLRELGVFFQDQCWMHMYHVLRSQGITFHELGHRGREATLVSLKAQGISREEASSELGR